jgi:hypothetical protein
MRAPSLNTSILLQNAISASVLLSKKSISSMVTLRASLRVDCFGEHGAGLGLGIGRWLLLPVGLKGVRTPTFSHPQCSISVSGLIVSLTRLLPRSC